MNTRCGHHPWLAASVLVFVVSGISPFGPVPAFAQARCGSAQQVIEQIAASVIAQGVRSEWFGVVSGGAGLVLTESPGDMFRRCWREATGEDETSRPDATSRTDEPPRRSSDGWSSLDPHLTTFDRLTFDFHGAGDYVLVEQASADAEVQTRYVRRDHDLRFSAQEALALRVGDRVVTLYEAGPDGADAVILDGQPVPFQDGGWYEDQDLRIQQFGQWTFVRFGNGLAAASARGWINRVHIPAAWAGEVSGFLGNRDGDPGNDVARRDGTAIDPRDPDALYGDYLTDWLVEEDDSLFSIPFDVDAMGPILPGAVPTLATLPADAVAAARQVCLRAGLQPDQGLEGCVFDVALTGDESWATGDAGLPGPVMSAAVVAPRVTRTMSLDTGVVAGSLEAPDVAHEVLVPAATGDGSRVLQPSGSCEAAMPAAVVVMDGGQPRTQRSLVCGARLELPASAHRLLVVHPGGGTADYAFRVTERAPDGLLDDGPLPLDTELAIQAGTTGQRWRWTLDDVETADLFIRPEGPARASDGAASVCTARWSLLDASDGELTGGSLCIDVPRLRAANADTFAVDVPAGVAATFVVGLVGAGTSTASDLDDRVRYDADLQSPGQIDTYTLEPEAGTELVLLDPVGANDCGVVWSVSEGGAEVFRGPSCFDTDPISVTTSGTVEIAVRAGSEPGPYSLEIVRVPEPRVEALRFGEPLDGAIATPGARVVFTFAGTAGDELVLANPAGANTNCQLVWRITGPDADDDDDADTVFQGPTCLDTDPIRLVATGPHVLEIDGNRAATGEAAVTVFPVPQPRTEALRFGETLEASIETPGQRVRFTFDGAAGDELTLTDPEGRNENCQLVWRVIGPDGEGVVFEGPVCFEVNSIVLETSGPHVVEVDGRLAATGSVSLTVGRR